ncbi:tigger transposable element-derived protein 6 [Trichonephila clavipes]|nr:tigger transposable element-derived protein 6 [Trichonephila clavipes]
MSDSFVARPMGRVPLPPQIVFLPCISQSQEKSKARLPIGRENLGHWSIESFRKILGRLDGPAELAIHCGDLRFLPVNFDKPWATTLHITSVSTYHAKGTTSSFKKYKCLTISEKQKVIESVEEALIMIDKAWRAVTPLTIHSCFKNSSITRFDDYVLVDTDIAVWGALSNAEIVTLDHNNTESDEDESEELTPVTLSEAKVSLNKLRNFSLQNHVDADILRASFVLEKSIAKVRLNALKQNKITDFFDEKD